MTSYNRVKSNFDAVAKFSFIFRNSEFLIKIKFPSYVITLKFPTYTTQEFKLHSGLLH